MGILANIQVVLFDLDGTLYNGETAIPGAVEATERLRMQGIALRFVTNTTSRGRAVLAEKLHRLGFQVDESEVFNPTAAAGAYLRQRDDSAFILALPAAQSDFAGVRQDDENPDYVVVGDLGDHWTYALLNQAFRLLHRGAGLIALGMSRYWLAADGYRLDVGPFVAALAYASDAKPVVLGKPDAEFFRLVLADAGVSPSSQALMVGDDIQTDVGGAQMAGLRTALVRTGKFVEADLSRGIVPDVVLASVADLALLSR
ncbi:MAG: TIGR01458 family HAD-type hydrolase [Anaerolineae bacterium]|nr:TIGR01458 family HAD-type hydrolase [Anaerolineae bacterium]